MKRLLPLILVVIACNKPSNPTPTPNPCNINQSLLTDIDWHTSNAGLAKLKFASTGVYYENDSNDGNWAVSNGCDSLYITRPVNNFHYRIAYLTVDTLKLLNPMFGEIIYTN